MTSYSAALGEYHVDEAGTLVAKAVVVVAPGGGGQQDVERGDGVAPGELYSLLKPLGVLHGHRGGHHRERLIGGEHAVPAREQIAFQPALAVVLAEYFHHAAIGRNVVIDGDGLADEAAVFDLEYVAEAVGVGLVGAEEAEVGFLAIVGRRCRAEACPTGGWTRRESWRAW